MVRTVKIVRSITIRPELWKKLKEYAFKHDKTISQCVEEAIELLLERGDE